MTSGPQRWVGRRLREWIIELLTGLRKRVCWRRREVSIIVFQVRLVRWTVERRVEIDSSRKMDSASSKVLKTFSQADIVRYASALLHGRW